MRFFERDGFNASFFRIQAHKSSKRPLELIQKLLRVAMAALKNMVQSENPAVGTLNNCWQVKATQKIAF